MWFRNLQLFRLVDEFTLDAERLAAALETRPFRPCSGLDTVRFGWTPPAGRASNQLVHAADGRLMICQRREERLLPAAVVREQVEERVDAITEREARPVGRGERRQLRDAVFVELLPRAFTRSRFQFAYIDPRAGWIVVDSSSARQAEELMSALRETLGSLRIRPIAVRHNPAHELTRWLTQSPPRDFELGDECELREPVDNGAVVRGRRVDLAAGDVRPHLDNGMVVGQIAIHWQDRLACVIGADLGLRRLRFLDRVLDEAGDVAGDDELARFDADFALMTHEIARFLPDLLQALGGADDD